MTSQRCRAAIAELFDESTPNGCSDAGKLINLSIPHYSNLFGTAVGKLLSKRAQRLELRQGSAKGA
jgi:hypothetical protein